MGTGSLTVRVFFSSARRGCSDFGAMLVGSPPLTEGHANETESGTSSRHRHRRRWPRGESCGPGFPLEPRGDTLTLPNYFMTSIGQTGGLQGGAYVARATTPRPTGTTRPDSRWRRRRRSAAARATTSSSASFRKTSRATTPAVLADRSRRSSESSSRTCSATSVDRRVLDRPDELLGAGHRRSESTPCQPRPARLLGQLGVSPHRSQPRARLHLCERAWRFGATIAGTITSLRAVGSIFDEQIQSGRPRYADWPRVGRAARSPSFGWRAGAQYQLTAGDPPRRDRPHARGHPVPERRVHLRRPAKPRAA